MQRARLDAHRADLFGGPNVVVPPKELMASEPHDIPTQKEMVKNHSDEELSSSAEEVTPRTATPVTRPSTTTPADDFALAFDIDGVLVKGGQAIPEAVDALKYINGENPYGIKVYVLFSFPSLFVTFRRLITNVIFNQTLHLRNERRRQVRGRKMQGSQRSTRATHLSAPVHLRTYTHEGVGREVQHSTRGRWRGREMSYCR